jgi:CRISPR system Cascade subunit CasC
MTIFLQLHLLTSYPPACLNRDDLNRPKTAVMGGVPRLRISSQSLKRAWRTSDVFESKLKGHIGKRTKIMGVEIYNKLQASNIGDAEAKEWAQAIARQFGKLEAQSPNEPLKELEIKQLAHFSPEEERAMQELVKTLAQQNRSPTPDELELLRKEHKAADIALFGRMLADSPKFNKEAACQVAHAITVHKAAVEDDFFTAVDDLNARGSAYMGEQGFGAGLFYLYVCINRDLLKENLLGDDDLAKKAIHALAEAAAKVSPTGKQNSFASRACAYYILAEKGDRQPRSLSLAFMKPVSGGDMLEEAVKALEAMRENIDKVYYEGKSLEDKKLLALPVKGMAEGDMKQLLDFISS